MQDLRFDGAAIDFNGIPCRIDCGSELVSGLPVYPYAALHDKVLGGAPGSHSTLGKVALQTYSLRLVVRRGMASVHGVEE